MHVGMVRGHGHLREEWPGSPEAVECGCTCDPVLNRQGEGQGGASANRLFRPDRECPLHGFDAVFGLSARRYPSELYGRAPMGRTIKESSGEITGRFNLVVVRR
jgi:hypothetical protein